VSRRISPDIESELSQRELQLLVYASRGLTDQAIAHELGLSLATIATYWGRIRIKLGPLNRTELVAKYLDSKSSEEIVQLQNEVSTLRQQLEASKKDDLELLLALNKIPDSVVLIDTSSKVLYVNEATCLWLGYAPEEMIGSLFLDFYPDGRHDLWKAWLDGLLEDPQDPEFALNRPSYVRHKDGTVKVFSCNSAVYKTSQGIRILAVSRRVD
jgi:PAS domain S-box-containing protein